MSTQDNGLTLEGLAQRLETQARRLETLERENTELRDEVTALRGSDTHRSGAEPAMSGFAGQVSRGSLLSKAGAAAVAAVAAGTLLSPREAEANHSPPNSGIKVDFVETHFVRAARVSGDGAALTGDGVIGVRGISRTDGQAGVVGTQLNTQGGGPGVVGEGRGPDHAGVLGRNSNGGGGTGVWGQSGRAGYSGVYGQHTGTGGYGVVGDGMGAGNAGVLGRNNTGDGIRGEGKVGVFGKSSTGTAPGVLGESTGGGMAGVFGRNVNGYGGTFTGGKAQLRLYPGINVGKPTGAHSQGEVYMDKAANLFVCTVSGNPATWRKVSTTAVAVT